MNISYQSLSNYYGHAFGLGRLLAQKTTPYQEMSIYETEGFGKLLLLDGLTQVFEKGEHFYHESMTHPPLLLHPHPKDVLIIGAGDGGILREVLKHPCVKTLTHVELDGDVVDFCRQHLPMLSDGAWNDPRTTLLIEDGRQYVETTDRLFDVILMDMTDPIGPSKLLYTKEYYQKTLSRLKPGGIYCMHSESPILTPRMYSDISTTLSSVFSFVKHLYVYIQMYGGLWSFALCSKTELPTLDEVSLQKRIRERKLEGRLKLINGETLRAISVEYPEFSKMRKGGRIVTDAFHVFDEIEPQKLLFSQK